MVRNKSEIKRTDLRKNMMKKIIFRIDYQGVINPNDTIHSFNQNFPKAFLEMQTTFHNKVDFEMNNIEEMSETLSIPIKEIEKQEIFRFASNTFGRDTITLDISRYFTTLTIDCNNYVNIDEYLTFFSKLTDMLYETNSYLIIKRIGLRKIGGLIFESIGDIFKVFDKKYFNFDFQGTEFHSIRNRYIDVLQRDNESPFINYVRNFETGKYFKEEVSKEVDAYQVMLDIDGYYTEDILQTLKFKKGSILKLLESTNNDHLFNLYKMSVTDEYLNKNCHE